MKNNLAVTILLLSAMLAACAPRKVTSAPSDLPSPKPTAEAASSAPSSDALVPEVSTTLPDNGTPTKVPGRFPPVSQPSDASAIVLEDNGKTFTYHVGDSFLLNLGADIYDWEIKIDNQNVFAMKMGVMVIQGAQGIYDALAPGTTILTAVGSPKCLQSTPPCGMPTLLFKVTLVVQ